MTGVFHYTIKGNLQERLIDIKCLLGIIQHENITIGKQLQNLPLKMDNITRYDTEFFKNNLHLLELVEKLLVKLHVVKVFDYDKVSESDEKTLIVLINTILFCQKYHQGKNNSKYLYKISIANITLSLVAIRIDNEDYMMYDFFDEKNTAQFSFQYKDNDTQPISIPSTYILRKSDFIELANIDYTKVLNDIKLNQTSKELKKYTFLYLNEMIEAYNSNTKNIELRNCINISLEILLKKVPEHDYVNLQKKILKA